MESEPASKRAMHALSTEHAPKPAARNVYADAYLQAWRRCNRSRTEPTPVDEDGMVRLMGAATQHRCL